MRNRVRPGDPKAAVAYIRASTEEQRLGPQAQRMTIEAWAEREEVQILAWYVDHGVSGGSDLSERPNLIAALGQLRAKRAGVLVIAKRDRLARDVAVAATIDRAVASNGGRVVSADGVANGVGAADDFLRAILDAAAQYERALIRCRTKAALATKRARGERIGTVPFGSRVADDGVALIEEPSEKRTLDTARALRIQGLSFRAIARELAERGFVSRTGRAIALSRVHKMAAGT
ncbi:MAG: recombinase family protein [Polyangiaceae bacterium]